MILKYPRIGRIHLSGNKVFKRYLSNEEIKQLFSEEVVIEEKIDGGIIALTRDKVNNNERSRCF